MAKSNESKDNTDQTDDLITLTGLNKVSTWRFPPNLKKCPLFRCGSEFKSRSLAIAHYKANHAATSVQCFLCKKVISVSNTANYRTHFNRVHPHVKLSQSQHPKVKSASRSHFVKTHSIATQSNHDKKTCKICGMKFHNLSRHVMEMHTKRRILCPLKSCDFTSKRLNLIRRHWKNSHRNLRFPEIAKDSGFTYKTTTADAPVRVNNFFIFFSIFF